jgi:hypothetical protein
MTGLLIMWSIGALITLAGLWWCVREGHVEGELLVTPMCRGGLMEVTLVLILLQPISAMAMALFIYNARMDE